MDLDLDQELEPQPHPQPLQLPPQLTKIKIVPEAEKTTMLATATGVESSSGVFIFTLAELRPVKAYFAEERFKNDTSVCVEIGRFALTPMTLVNLKKQIAAAEEIYVRQIGPLPDPQLFAQNCFNELTDDFKRSLGDRPIGFRQSDARTQPLNKSESSEDS